MCILYITIQLHNNLVCYCVYDAGLNEVCAMDRFCQLRPGWDGLPTTHPDEAPDVFEEKDILEEGRVVI